MLRRWRVWSNSNGDMNPDHDHDSSSCRPLSHSHRTDAETTESLIGGEGDLHSPIVVPSENTKGNNTLADPPPAHRKFSLFDSFRGTRGGSDDYVRNNIQRRKCEMVPSPALNSQLSEDSHQSSGGDMPIILDDDDDDDDDDDEDEGHRIHSASDLEHAGLLTKGHAFGFRPIRSLRDGASSESSRRLSFFFRNRDKSANCSSSTQQYEIIAPDLNSQASEDDAHHDNDVSSQSRLENNSVKNDDDDATGTDLPRRPFFLFGTGFRSSGKWNAQQHYEMLPPPSLNSQESSDELNEPNCETDDENCGDTSPSADIDGRDEFESLLSGHDTACFDEDMLVLWKRRKRFRGNVMVLGFGIKEKSATSISVLNMASAAASSARMEAGGGCNEENMRALELESHLNSLKERCSGMIHMDIMLAREKEMHDLFWEEYEMDMRSMYDIDVEPEFGWDNLGWYETLATCECIDDDVGSGSES
mmetsp:Transcript_6035/g.13246  ORF Transcript_6035/g.13246 Transcript_6035/m.13246 type:complete len:475 (-) Transcript_6035:8-1432(-)